MTPVTYRANSMLKFAIPKQKPNRINFSFFKLSYTTPTT
ncbi:Uncharacterised protein [Vibrio cholerae]|nr:Uncharacterised protein [Vibrio cholerae]